MKERYFWWYAILCFFLTPRLFPNVITLHKNNPRFFRFCFIIVAPFLNFLLKCCPLKLVCIYLMANWPFFKFFIGDQKRRKKQRQVKETVVVFLRHKKGKTVWSKRQDGAYTWCEYQWGGCCCCCCVSTSLVSCRVGNGDSSRPWRLKVLSDPSQHIVSFE